MANREQLKILKRGVEIWNNWRDKHPDAEIDLSEADLYHVVLSNPNSEVGINLGKANLKST